METKHQIKYNKSLLYEILKRDEATLVGEYHKINSKTRINFICKCGKENNKEFSWVYKKSKFNCIDCINKQKYETYKKTNLEKYGVDNLSKLQYIKDKKKETTLKNFGVEYPGQSLKVKEKAKITNLKKYGVECVLKNKQINEKIKETTMKKFGVEHNSQSQSIKNKKKETTFKNFGVEYPGQSLEIKEKIKITNLEKYGVENPSQNLEIFDKTQKNAKKYKTYVMPSGEIRLVQGYEPFALDILVKEFTEDQILTERNQIPRIPYKINGKQKYYFPDIFLPHLYKIIEVKSTWTYKCKLDNIFHKEKATKELGYTYEFWVFDSKGKRLSEEELLFV
jgi:hypothetical protein